MTASSLRRFLAATKYVALIAAFAAPMTTAPRAPAGVTADGGLVSCDSTGLGGTVIYVGGSSAAKPMLKNVSLTLATQTNAIRLIYISLGSCAGLSDITSSTAEKSTGTYWDNTNGNAELSCAPGGGAGAQLDVAVSDVYATTCNNITLGSMQKDFPGSTQMFSFIVAQHSKHNTISSEAAFVTYGFGGASNAVDTWSNPSFIYKRDPTKSGSYSMLAALLNLSQAKMLAAPDTIPGAGKTPDVLNAVYAADAMNPDASLGVVSQDYADANRVGTSSTTPVKSLAFQDKGGSCAIYPDSGATKYDKSNVRTGKYPFWGPVHFITNTDGSGNPVKTQVATLLSFFTRQGLDATNKQKMIDNEVAAFTVPQCAMQVQRAGEVSPDSVVTPFTPTEPCGCYFEYKATGSTSCTACTSTCNTGVCRYGYCEAQ
jgi:ABC-type phosphate transport system substrate-binding protein